MIINNKVYGNEVRHDDGRFIRRDKVTVADLYEIFDDQLSNLNKNLKAIYVFYGRDGEVLYCGRSKRLKARFCEHTKTAEWFGEIYEIRVYPLDFKNEERIISMFEEIMMQNLQPKYNERKSVKEENMNKIIIKRRGFDLEREKMFKFLKELSNLCDQHNLYIGGIKMLLKNPEDVAVAENLHYDYGAKMYTADFKMDIKNSNKGSRNT